MAHDTQAAPPVDGGYTAPAGAGTGTGRDLGRGWAVFAGVLFVSLAALNTLYGLAALLEEEHFSADGLLFGDVPTWGTVYLLFAPFQLAVGVLLLRQRAFGAFLGIALAVLHGTAALASIGAYPLWTTIALVIDGFIVYGLSVYGADWA
jgi:hypothetical protein